MADPSNEITNERETLKDVTNEQDTRDVTIQEMLAVHKECRNDDTLCAKRLISMKPGIYSGTEENSLRAKIRYSVAKVRKMKKKQE